MPDELTPSQAAVAQSSLLQAIFGRISDTNSQIAALDRKMEDMRRELIGRPEFNQFSTDLSSRLDRQFGELGRTVEFNTSRIDKLEDGSDAEHKRLDTEIKRVREEDFPSLKLALAKDRLPTWMIETVRYVVAVVLASCIMLGITFYIKGGHF